MPDFDVLDSKNANGLRKAIHRELHYTLTAKDPRQRILEVWILIVWRARATESGSGTALTCCLESVGLEFGGLGLQGSSQRFRIGNRTCLTLTKIV